ncbi:MAG: hypothetical protein WBE86_07780 [Candidatus Acidiferrales bacterium]
MTTYFAVRPSRFSCCLSAAVLCAFSLTTNARGQGTTHYGTAADAHYFVSSEGSDSYDGLSTWTAFRTPQHCVAVAIGNGGGTCDASRLHTALFSTELDVGNSSGVPVNLLLPDYGTWTFHLTGGTEYALKVFNQSSAIGPKTGLGLPFVIIVDGTSEVDSVCGTDPAPPGGPAASSYIRMSGFSCQAASGAVVANAILNIYKLFDKSRIDSVSVGSFTTNTLGVWVHQACCGTTVTRIASMVSNATGNVPCQLGNENEGVIVNGLSCLRPGPGKNALVITQNNYSEPSDYRNIYIETLSDPDTTTAAVAIIGGGDLYQDLLDGVLLGQDVPSSTRYLLDIGAGASIFATRLSLGYSSPNGINDHNPGRGTISPGTRGFIASYDSPASTPPILAYGSFFSSTSANSSASAIFNCANADTCIAQRNSAGTADVPLSVFNAAGIEQKAWHIVEDSVTLSEGRATATLSGNAAFTSSSSYSCVATDANAAALARANPASGTSITVTGVASDTVRYVCVGN